MIPGLVKFSNSRGGRLFRTVHVISPGNRHGEINAIHDWSMVHLKLSLRGRESFFSFMRISGDQAFVTFNFTLFHYLRNQTSCCLAPRLWQQEVLECAEGRKARVLWSVVRSLPWWITQKAMERRAGLLLLIFDESISCGGQCGYRRIKHTLSVPRKLGDECCSLAWIFHGSF